MFKRKKIEPPSKEVMEEITRADEVKLNRIKALKEYVHQLDTDRNMGRITNTEWYREILKVEREVSAMENKQAFDEMMGNPLDWEIFK